MQDHDASRIPASPNENLDSQHFSCAHARLRRWPFLFATHDYISLDCTALTPHHVARSLQGLGNCKGTFATRHSRLFEQMTSLFYGGDCLWTTKGICEDPKRKGNNAQGLLHYRARVRLGQISVVRHSPYCTRIRTGGNLMRYMVKRKGWSHEQYFEKSSITIIPFSLS